ncbi:MAG: FAD-dependent oxidoreductase [Niabella sp.]|nr:FAD-dependent oxidoreductase [Niabella sp.]
MRKNILWLATLLFAIPGSANSAKPYTADVVIYGGTAAAVIAAVEVAQSGKKVIIVSPDKHLGGMTSSGLGFTDTGDKSVIGGLARDFYHRIWAYYNQPQTWKWEAKTAYGNKGQGTLAIDGANRTMWIFEPHIAEQVFEDYIREYKIPVYRDEWLNRESGVTLHDKKIASITTLSKKQFSARVFIDATYEGDLMAAAGIAYTVGREANSVYGETWNGIEKGVRQHRHNFLILSHPVDPYKTAGDKSSGLLAGISNLPPGNNGEGDHRIQAYCYRVCMSSNAQNRVPFPKPAHYNAADYELLIRIFDTGWDEWFQKFDAIPNKKTDTNNHGPFSADYIGANYAYPDASYAARRRILKAHETYQKGLLWFVANDPRVPGRVRSRMQQWGLPKDEFKDNGGWPWQLYIREARRMNGIYTMTQQDVLSKKETPHSIGMGSYAMDAHNAQRYVDEAGHVQNEGDIGVGPDKPYKIAFESILPQKEACSNLLVPVCLSSSHIAYGSIRMEPVFMILGQSAAVAAELAIDQAAAVQDLSYGNVQKVLETRGQILSRQFRTKKPAVEPDRQ